MALRHRVGMVLVMIALAIPAAHSAELAILRNGFSIRHERSETQGEVTRLYLTGTPNDDYVDISRNEIVRFEKIQDAPARPRSISAFPASIEDLVTAESRRNHMDPDVVMSLISAESGFNPDAVSPKGARGLMQLMPRTAADLGVKDPMDPVANIEGGLRYLRQLLALYNNDLVKALAAYNAGPRRIQQYHGVPPYPETRVYLYRILNDINRRKLPIPAGGNISQESRAEK
jgi:hypothetical protein